MMQFWGSEKPNAHSAENDPDYLARRAASYLLAQ